MGRRTARDEKPEGRFLGQLELFVQGPSLRNHWKDQLLGVLFAVLLILLFVKGASAFLGLFRTDLRLDLPLSRIFLALALAGPWVSSWLIWQYHRSAPSHDLWAPSKPTLAAELWVSVLLGIALFAANMVLCSAGADIALCMFRNIERSLLDAQQQVGVALLSGSVVGLALLAAQIAGDDRRDRESKLQVHLQTESEGL